MSEQVRFKIEGCKVNPDLASICITFVKDENGEYVRYEDYARMEAERDASKRCWDSMKEEWDKLVKENIRLRKAGDAIIEWFGVNDYSHKVIKEWNAAKEVQP